MSKFPSPTRVRNELEARDQTGVDEAIDRIEKYIRTSWDGRGSVAWSTRGLSVRQVEAIIKVLVAAGWSARRVSDQRDGDYLEIREAATPALVESYYGK